MITAEEYGKLPNGEIAYLYTIVNRHGNRLSITNYGCRIVALTIKDKVGDYRDVVLGYDDLDGYVNDKHWMGAALGINVVNRTSGSTVHDGVKVFVSDGESKPEDAQDSVLFGDKLFDCIIVGQENQETIVMSCEHKLQNGKINISVSYCFSEDNQLIVSENVVSDTNIEFNFVQQVMLNLNGQGAIDGHTAIVNAKYVGSTHGRWTPSEYTPVEGRVNLNAPKSLKNLSKAKHKLIKKSDGLDLSYQLNINPTDVGTDKLFYAGRVR
ncbi:MAG: hypothetical protein FWF58_01430, partial [Firmicutes bacterium]|nr:hypothetical protein [Bacillota bacterium]